MDIFNQVRITPVYLQGSGEIKDPVVTDVENLKIRFNPNNGHVLLFEKTDDDVDDWFEFGGWVIGSVEVDEYGMLFKAYDGYQVVRVIVTRKGVYG